MERVYLLLRNNQQSGPFTIGELLQQQLRPSDMIWIEGKSAAWTYLSELELIPFVKKTELSEQSLSAKKSDEIERKAEELRQRILTTPPRTYFPNYTTEIETYASPYKREDEIELVDHRKEKRAKNNAVFGELFLTCLVIGLFMIGIYKGNSFLGARHKVQHSVATELDSKDEHAARKNNTNKQVTIPVIDTARQRDSLLAMEKAKQKNQAIKKVLTDSSAIKLPVIAVKKQDAIIQAPPPVSSESTAKKEDTPVKRDIVSSVPEIKANNETVKEEKKGFLRGLFKKKKKENNGE